MTDREALITEGRATMCRLFDIAVRRLAERDIALTFNPGVVDWMAGHAVWRGTVWFESLNPLRTLDGVWQTQVGRPIEDNMVKRVLTPGGSVRVDVSSTHPVELTFEIITGNGSHPGT
jgi:hypothetical protein